MGQKVTYWGPDKERGLSEGQSITVDDRSLTEAQAESVGKCDNHLAEVLAAGFVDPVTGKTFQADDDSQRKLTSVGVSALAAVVVQASPAFTIIAADNTTISLSPADALALLNGRMFPWVSGCILANRVNKTAILALLSNGACDQFDVGAGYPKSG